MFRRIVFVAALAGLIAGLVASGLQALRLVPLIHQAEVFETAAGAAMPAGHDHAGHDHAGHDHAGHDHGAMAWEPSEGLERVGLTVVANVLIGVGFGFLIAAGLALTGVADWRRGLLWGLAGFATFMLAPSLGLPPEPPGADAAPLLDRQLWWIGTAAATAAGLGLIVFPRRWWAALAGAVLIALPHILGAPQPLGSGAAPESLAQQFMIAALLGGLVFWLVLGAAAGFFFKRLSTA
jgi:cobalt transporter subunit CbtA